MANAQPAPELSGIITNFDIFISSYNVYVADLNNLLLAVLNQKRLSRKKAGEINYTLAHLAFHLHSINELLGSGLMKSDFLSVNSAFNVAIVGNFDDFVSDDKPIILAFGNEIKDITRIMNALNDAAIKYNQAQDLPF